MKRGTLLLCVFWSVILCLCVGTLEVQAEIASDDAFEGVVWEKIIEDRIEAPFGVVQSVCATEDYIITLENTADGAPDVDVVKAYYRNDTDADGKSVKKYSLAKRVAATNYEHANGMAYNPDTKEIAVALYTSGNPENRGCVFLMDSETLEYKGRVQIASDYNILGIDYDEEKKQYVIQTNVDGGYSFKILNDQFQVTEDLGSYAHTAKGDNFQDLCISGDYIINFPLTLNLGIGDYIHMYSISRREMVSDAQLDFRFENVVEDEPESICELEPGVFVAAVNVVYADGRRNICLYKTMVPYNFPAEQTEKKKEKKVEKKAEKKKKKRIETVQDKKEKKDKKEIRKMTGAELLQHTLEIVFVILGILTVILGGLLVLYIRYVRIQRARKRKLEKVRRERERIRSLYNMDSKRGV